MGIFTQFVHKTAFAIKVCSHKKNKTNLICSGHTICASEEFGMQNAVETVDLRVILEGESAKQFLEIKKELGLSQNTEVVRAIINRYYNKKMREA
jgi:hypothetical protein